METRAVDMILFLDDKRSPQAISLYSVPSFSFSIVNYLPFRIYFLGMLRWKGLQTSSMYFESKGEF